MYMYIGVYCVQLCTCMYMYITARKCIIVSHIHACHGMFTFSPQGNPAILQTFHFLFHHTQRK